MIFIIGVILGAVVVIFILQNIMPISVVFLGWQFNGSLAVILILAIIAGMLISWLLSIPDMLRLSDIRSHNRKLQQDLALHQQKLSETEGKLVQATETPVIIEKTIVLEKEHPLV